MIRYVRNRIYISSDEQKKLKNYRIFLAGCGIGSSIAECAIRLGVENITLVDGDVVELSNLNRQNYTFNDLGMKKVDALKKRLLSINPYASITTYDRYLYPDTNINRLIDGHAVAINALDFQTNMPFVFDNHCMAKRIPILYPYNIGWATLVYIIQPQGPDLSIISRPHNRFELSVVRCFLD